MMPLGLFRRLWCDLFHHRRCRFISEAFSQEDGSVIHNRGLFCFQCMEWKTKQTLIDEPRLWTMSQIGNPEEW